MWKNDFHLSLFLNSPQLTDLRHILLAQLYFG